MSLWGTHSRNSTGKSAEAYPGSGRNEKVPKEITDAGVAQTESPGSGRAGDPFVQSDLGGLHRETGIMVKVWQEESREMEHSGVELRLDSYEDPYKDPVALGGECGTDKGTVGAQAGGRCGVQHGLCCLAPGSH